MEFAPISIYLIVSLLLSLILIGVSFLFAASSNLAYPEKLSAYECGFDPFDDARSRFDTLLFGVYFIYYI
jgi:NADH-ubiquinone oxidoreductase chain 3